MMSELKFFLELQIKQKPRGIYIHQTKYVKELLKKFNLSDEKGIKTLMHPITHLGLDKESTKVDGTLYKAIIGSLLYLGMPRLDICFLFVYVLDSKRNQGKFI